MEHVERFVSGMRAQFYPMKFKQKLKNTETGQDVEVETTRLVEGVMRPIQLWEYVLPEEYVQPVCNNLGIPTDEKFFDQGENKGGTSFRSGFGVQGYLTALRLMLKAKPIPKDLSKGYWPNPIYKNFVNILGIGWRSDVPIHSVAGDHEGI